MIIALSVTGKRYINAKIAEAILMHIEPEKELKDLFTSKEFEIFKLLAMGKTILLLFNFIFYQ